MKMLLVTSFRWKYRKIEPLEGIGWISLCVAFVQSKYETVKNDVYILPGICFRIFQLNPKTEKEAEECDTIDVPTVDPVKLGDELWGFVDIALSCLFAALHDKEALF